MPTAPHAAAPDSRAGRKRARTHRAILDAARGLCAEHGYPALTVAAIAEAADLGVGTFYYHFQTKDDVLVALMEELLGRIQSEITRARKELRDPLARLRAGYRAFFRLSGADKDLLRVYYSSAAARADFTASAREFFEQDTVALIRQGQERGMIRAGDPHLLAQWVIGGTTEAVQYLLSQDAPFDAGDADRLTDLVVHGLAAESEGPAT